MMIKTKTATFAVVHFCVAFVVVYLLTGSWVLGGAVALIEPAVNTLAYYFHELGWKRFERWRASPNISPDAKSGLRA